MEPAVVLFVSNLDVIPFLQFFILICQFSTRNNKLATQMFLSSYFRYKSVKINKADFSCFKLVVGGRMYSMLQLVLVTKCVE